VRLIPAQYVKPYVKTNKTDYIDAEAIAEAVSRPTMRFVPIKSGDQLDLQSLHLVRERWVMRQTSVINQIRGLLLERGITVQNGRKYLEAVLPTILADDSGRLSGVVLARLTMELDHLNVRLEEVDLVIQNAVRENEACKRLEQIPGIGPLAAIVLIAAICDGAPSAKGREFTAWVGFVLGNTPLEVIRNCSASASAETHICVLYSWCTSCPASEREAISRSEPLVDSAGFAHSS
jgi:transposase